MNEQNSGFPAPATPRLKLGGVGRLGGLDPAAIARAEAALKSLSSNFAQWLQDEITKLEAARQVISDDGMTASAMESLYMRAHDLKGLGTTYGYPLITRIAGLLCSLIDDAGKRAAAPLPLIDGHLEAIRASVRDDVKTAEEPAGQAIIEDLESRVAAALAG